MFKKEIGRVEEVVGHYHELMRLNPDDNKGRRYLLLPRLIKLNHDVEAVRFMKKSKGEPTANWTSTQALLAYHLSSDSETTREGLQKAAKTNPFVTDCSLDDKNKRHMPDSYILGSREGHDLHGRTTTGYFHHAGCLGVAQATGSGDAGMSPAPTA